MKKNLPYALAALALTALVCGPFTAGTPEPEPSPVPETEAPAPPAASAGPTPEPPGEVLELALESAAFAPGESVPVVYTCDGQNISPPLAWGEPPDGTQSFALILVDPDAPAGTWVHWVLYNLLAGARGLPEAVPGETRLADGSLHGANSWGRPGYGGPCPPSGTHRYFFKLYALDTVLDLTPGANKAELERAMDRHILAYGELLGRYSR
jgi:Raf kinase inhibitor-like YbhB/YbcL family protein